MLTAVALQKDLGEDAGGVNAAPRRLFIDLAATGTVNGTAAIDCARTCRRARDRTCD
jgi:hypothetical protein